MTLRTNARLAGITFLLYIVTGIASLMVFNRASGGAEIAARLASIAQHETLVRMTAVLSMLQFFYPIVLAVTIYALTRDVDRDLALLAVGCRFAEGVVIAMATDARLQLLAVAKTGVAATGGGAAAASAIGSMLLSRDVPVAAICFVIGSTFYCWLFVRGRSIPAPLAWLGFLSSVLLLIALFVQMAGFLHGPVTYFVWIPMALFEVAVALWFIVKGVKAPEPRLATAQSG